MSLNLININSKFFDDNWPLANLYNRANLENRIQKMNQKYWNKPIYCVDPDLMEILYPKSKYYELDLTKMSFNPEIFNLSEPSLALIEGQTIGLGVYFSNFKHTKYKSKLNRILKSYSKNISVNIKNIISQCNGPCIFICPERIANIGNKNNTIKIDSFNKMQQDTETFRKEIEDVKKLMPDVKDLYYSLENQIKKLKYQEPEIDAINNQFNTLLIAVCLHEIAHNYMDSRLSVNYNRRKLKIDDRFNKLIEESFANVFSLAQFENNEEREVVQNFMDSQPLEYKAYQYWLVDNTPKRCLPFLISSWIRKEDLFNNDYVIKYFEEIFQKPLFDVSTYDSLVKSSLEYTFEKRKGLDSFLGKLRNRDYFKNSWEAIGWSMLYFMNDKNYHRKPNQQ